MPRRNSGVLGEVLLTSTLAGSVCAQQLRKYLLHRGIVSPPKSHNHDLRGHGQRLRKTPGFETFMFRLSHLLTNDGSKVTAIVVGWFGPEAIEPSNVVFDVLALAVTEEPLWWPAASRTDDFKEIH